MSTMGKASIRRYLQALGVALAAMLPAQPAAAASLMKVLEFADGGVPIPSFIPQVVEMPPLVEQSGVDFSGGAVQSAALNLDTRLVFINCSVRCSIKFETGASSVTVTNTPLAADAPHYFKVRPQSPAVNYKISVIASP